MGGQGWCSVSADENKVLIITIIFLSSCNWLLLVYIHEGFWIIEIILINIQKNLIILPLGPGLFCSKFLPFMLLSIAQKIHPLCSIIYYAQII